MDTAEYHISLNHIFYPLSSFTKNQSKSKLFDNKKIYSLMPLNSKSIPIFRMIFSLDIVNEVIMGVLYPKKEKNGNNSHKNKQLCYDIRNFLLIFIFFKYQVVFYEPVPGTAYAGIPL